MTETTNEIYCGTCGKFLGIVNLTKQEFIIEPDLKYEKKKGNTTFLCACGQCYRNSKYPNAKIIVKARKK